MRRPARSASSRVANGPYTMRQIATPSRSPLATRTGLPSTRIVVASDLARCSSSSAANDSVHAEGFFGESADCSTMTCTAAGVGAARRPETGAAAGMAAGAAVEMLGGTPSQSGHATALAQQGTLGLVCDPLGGLVELPCVFRNATGAAIALAAIEMAMAGITFAIPADEVIDTMGEIGKAMDVRYRETAGGGLAATPTGRRLAKERLVQIKRADG